MAPTSPNSNNPILKSQATKISGEKANGEVPKEFETVFTLGVCSEIYRALDNFGKANEKLPFSIAWNLDDLKRLFKFGCELYESRYQALVAEFGTPVAVTNKQATYNVPQDKYPDFQKAASILSSTQQDIDIVKIKAFKAADLLKANLAIPDESLRVLRLYELIIE